MDWQASTREQQWRALREPPVPLLLVLGPCLAGWPWSAAVARAASTLHVRGTGEDLEAPGARATLAFALEQQDVGSVVLCGQGPWPAAAGTTLAPLAKALHATCDGQAARPTVEGLWLEPTRGMLHLLGGDSITGKLSPSLPPSDPLVRLVQSLGRPGSPRVQRS